MHRAVGAVIDHLFSHASQSGTAILQGRLEPDLFDPVRQRRCFLHYSSNVLVHSQNTNLLNAILAGDGLLTRMEGEWWMGHHVESFA